VLDRISQPEFLAHVAEVGDYLKERLEELNSPLIREVRGRGLMLAVELQPEVGSAHRYCEALKDRGVLAKDTHEHTIRISPPLVISRDQVDWALEQFEHVLTRLDS